MLTQSEIKYKRLMEQAEKLFAQKGYRAVTMDEIANSAGISKTTIYGHFSSKEELFLQVVLSLMDRSYDFVQGEIDKISGVLEKIDFLLGYNMNISKDYSLDFYHDSMTVPYIKEELLNKKHEISIAIFRSIIEEGIKRGEIRNVDLDFITGLLVMIIDGFSKEYFSLINTKEDIDSLIEKFYDFLKYGLLGREDGKR